MGKAITNCLYQGETITIEQAIDIKEKSERSGGKKPEFTCTECNELVRPRRSRHNGAVAAHFQHIKVNQTCSLSPLTKSVASRKSDHPTNSKTIKGANENESIHLIVDGIKIFIPEKKFSWLSPEKIRERKNAELEVTTFPWNESKWRHWKSTNPEGYVFTQQDTLRSTNFLLMHRPQCSLIEEGEMLHGSRNTKNKVMVCANDLQSLQAYAVYIKDPMVRGAGPFRGDAGYIRVCVKCNILDDINIPSSEKKKIERLNKQFVSMRIDGDDEDIAHDEPVERPVLSTKDDPNNELLAEEVADTIAYTEGATKVIKVNAFERNPKAREACLQHHGYTCKVCGFDFEKVYGEFARGFIHVHHLVPLHVIGATYEVDPISDLIPMCPNCHAAIHLGGLIRSVEELRAMLKVQLDRA